MKKRLNIVLSLGTAALLLSVMVGCTSVNSAASTTSTASETTESQNTVTADTTSDVTSTKTMDKSEIQASLDASGDGVYDITWSPDESMVAFIREEQQANVYVWKTGESSATLISVAESTTSGFSWSPDSQYFLINVGHMGPGTITSTLIKASSLEVVSTDITTVSISAPVWSPDSKHLALSLDDEAGSGNIEIVIYSVEGNDTASLLKSTNSYGPYTVKYWDNSGNIGYTELTSTGDRTEKVIAAPTVS
jgi:dipeptidyl aminopeptidase/acylaminoacyl peptidase